MKLFNNTPNGAWYGVTHGNGFDCGSLDPDQTIDNPVWDNQQNVRVDFYALGDAPPDETAPFSVTVPQSGTGMAVTIGLYQE